MSMDNPRYQRLQQRIQALQPHQRAILSTAQDELTGAVAEADAREELRGMGAAQRQQAADRNFELSRGSLDLAQDRFANEKKDAKRGELLGLANLGISGGLGYLDMRNSQEQEQRTRDQEARIAARTRKLLNDGVY